jgi:uncharacterized protein (DUF488 family)
MTTLYTIGHSNHEITKFLALLKDNRILQLVDVRSAPYSKYNLYYNRETLDSKLKQQGIEYFYYGNRLGGRPTDPSCYKHRELPKEGTDYLHEVDYPEVMKKPFFQQGIHNLLELVEKKPTAIMCSEEDPAHCHRHHMIARYLLAEHPELTVMHIRGDGSLINARELNQNDKKTGEQLPLFSLIGFQELL